MKSSKSSRQHPGNRAVAGIARHEAGRASWNSPRCSPVRGGATTPRAPTPCSLSWQGTSTIAPPTPAARNLALLIPSVVGRRGDHRTWLTVAVAVAARAILDVPEATQRVLSGGLLQAEQLCADAEPDLAATRRTAQLALELVPGAVAWVERLGVRNRISGKTFAKHCAPTMIRCAVDGVVASGSFLTVIGGCKPCSRWASPLVPRQTAESVALAFEDVRPSRR